MSKKEEFTLEHLNKYCESLPYVFITRELAVCYIMYSLYLRPSSLIKLIHELEQTGKIKASRTVMDTALDLLIEAEYVLREEKKHRTMECKIKINPHARGIADKYVATWLKFESFYITPFTK